VRVEKMRRRVFSVAVVAVAVSSVNRQRDQEKGRIGESVKERKCGSGKPVTVSGQFQVFRRGYLLS
jgi:hypothetical protein